MPAVSVQCPNCAQSYSIDGSLVGRKARCKGCGQPFELTPSGEIGRPGPDSSSDPLSGPPSCSWSQPGPLPEKIGRFLIRERLGSGAFGTVYRASDPTLDRDVALKVPHPDFQRDERAVARFLREARAAARLRHPHIVTVFEAGSDAEVSYIASAFIPGKSLAEAIDDGPSDPRRAARIIGALADALHHAHEQGIVHRDVKPANVLLDREDRPHLTDFGLAHLTAASVKLTKANSILGTPAYLSPEQAAGKSDESQPASDQYSLGVALYELLCGRVPFAGPLEVVIYHTLNTAPLPLRAEHPEIPTELEAICLRALAKKPEDRYATCRELARDLGRWLAGRPTSLEVPAQAVATPIEARGPASLGPRPLDLPATVIEEPEPAGPPPLSNGPVTRTDGRRLPPRNRVIAGAAALLLAVLGVILYIVTDHGTVKLELSDPSAQVEVHVDRETIAVAGLGEPLRLRVGEHHFEVVGKDFETWSRSYTVKRGGKDVLRVELVPRAKAPPASIVQTAKKEEAPTQAVAVSKPPPLAAPPAAPAAAPMPVTFTARAIDLNRAISAAELLDPGWQVPFLLNSPGLDGRIDPGEYGPALFVDFTDKANPGKIIAGSVSGPADLSLYLFMGYTRTDLHIAALVYDDIIEGDTGSTERNDEIELFFDGDGKPNDTPPGWRVGNREGFRLKTDVKGMPDGYRTGMTSTDWSAVPGRFPGGYILEWRIPLALIDTQDGPESRPASEGSTFRFALAVVDNDRPSNGQDTIGVLWPSDVRRPIGPADAGEDGWKVKLHLGAIGMQADHRLKAPVLDGVLEPGEYGPPLKFSPTIDENPGRRSPFPFTTTWRDPADLDADVFSAWSGANLYFAIRVRDDVVRSAGHPKERDHFGLYFDTDRRSNDFVPPTTNQFEKSGPEGFIIAADSRGEKLPFGEFVDWDAAGGASPGGYLTEVRVALGAMDTVDGGGKAVPAAGATLRFNFIIVDSDNAQERIRDGTGKGRVLWLEPPFSNPYGGEPFWVVPLHLARPVRHELVTGPSNSAIDPDTGVFRWTPPYGSYNEQVTVRTVDRDQPGLRSERVIRLSGEGTGQPARIEILPSDWPPTPDPGGLLPPQIAIDTAARVGNSPRDREPKDIPRTAAPAPRERNDVAAGGADARTDAAAEPGFIPLYSAGDPLKQGWDHLGAGSITEESPGVLVTEGGVGLLRYTRRTFRDFMLRLEWKGTSPTAGNSGVYLRMPDLRSGPEDTSDRCYEVQICDASNDPGTGAIFATLPRPIKLPDRRSPTLFDGNWNHMEITAQGQVFRVAVNGEEINRFKGSRALRGYIALQNLPGASSHVQLRNIRIKPLDRAPEQPGGPAPVSLDDGFQPLFNGKDRTGWFVESGWGNTWRVERGELVVTGTGDYRNMGYLLTDQVFDDYLLRFDFRLSERAYSGVAFRAVPLEKVRSLPLRPEISIDSVSREPTGSLLWKMSGDMRDALAPYRAPELRPVGSWNQMEIELRESSLRITINDREVLKTDLDSLAELPDTLPKLSRRSGRIGFGAHTGTVRFRNVRIKPL